jgi:hypothetical protein
MKSILVLLVLISLFNDFAYPSDADTQKELVSILNELFDAVAPGKKEVWEKYLADTCLYNDENGKTYSKKELLADFNPLPPGYSGNLKVEDAQSQIYGDTAILSARALEHMNIFGQEITQRYLQTSTFVRTNGQWKMVAAQVIAINNDPPAISVDSKKLEKYTGRYQLGDQQFYTITVEQGKLIAQRTGRDKEELLAETAEVFFRKGAPRSRVLFDVDENGNVTRMLSRREGIDIVWTKVKE